MSDPNVEHGGWAADQPGSQLRRGRSPVLGAVALLLLVGGIAASVIGIVMIARDAGPGEERILSRGIVNPLGGEGLGGASFFEPDEAGDATIWLELGGPDNVRESIVAGTTCELTRSDGTTDTIEGRVQGTVVATDEHETIGQTTVGAGQNRIECNHVPFGPVEARGALMQSGHEFMVERGTPGDGLDGWWLVIPGVPAALLGLALTVRWRAGRVRPA